MPTEYPFMLSDKRCSSPAGVLAVCLLAIAAWTPASAQEAHAHAHDQAGASVAQMTLDQGHKWGTDAPLRAGMAAINKAFETDHPAIHAGTETDAQYEALAARIEGEVNTIVANCHLPAAADANLHHVIADLLQGAAIMRGKVPGRVRHDGAALVHGALIAYAGHFDDRPVDAEHN
jgi:hypothetical protein